MLRGLAILLAVLGSLEFGFSPIPALLDAAECCKQRPGKDGLFCASFLTPEGEVLLMLPDDLMLDEVFSGRVFLRPRGSVESDRQLNAGRLLTYKFLFDSQVTPVYNSVVVWRTPALVPDHNFRIVLLDSTGGKASHADIPVIAMVDTSPPFDFGWPRRVQPNHLFQITGKFDGNLVGTSIRIGNYELKVLAQSPRKSVVKSLDVKGLIPLHITGKGIDHIGFIKVVRPFPIAPAAVALLAVVGGLIYIIDK